MKKESLPKQYYRELGDLQAIDFVLMELQLYLDTHPDDLKAIKQFNRLALHRKKMKESFERQFGPLQSNGNSLSKHPWEWSRAPWPWQV